MSRLKNVITSFFLYQRLLRVWMTGDQYNKSFLVIVIEYKTRGSPSRYRDENQAPVTSIVAKPRSPGDQRNPTLSEVTWRLFCVAS